MMVFSVPSAGTVAGKDNVVDAPAETLQVFLGQSEESSTLANLNF